jgi:DNA polymerase-3 subunit beta
MINSLLIEPEELELGVEDNVSQALGVKVERAVLLKALGHVQSVVERRNTLQILANVKIVAENGFLSLTATDTDIEITEKISAEINAQGAITVPAHTLYDIIRKLPDGAQIELKGKESAGGKLDISSGSCNFSLASLPVNDFPSMENDNVTHSFKLLPLELISLIDKTKFAISTEETRYYLNGIFLHTTENNNRGDGKLCAVATDGHRLAKVEIDAPEGAKNMEGVIIPRKTVGEIRKLVEEGGSDVKVFISATKISFVCGDAVLISKLIDGTFPDYGKVIPSDNDKDAQVDAVALARAVDRVATISTEKTRAVKFMLEQGKLIVSVASEDNGTAKEELEVSYDNILIDTGFNSRYLLEMMSVIKGQNVQFRMRDGNAPALVTDCDDPSAVFVIMPMRI